MLISGEAGAGKTRLLAELALRARADGWQVLSGRAGEGAGMPPYAPWTDALRAHLRDVSPSHLQAQLGISSAALTVLLPELAGHLPDLPHPARSSEYERYHLFASVVHLLAGLSRTSGPAAGLLLLLDDLHWADAPTLQLLLHLAARLGDAPILVAGAYREEGLTPAAPLAGVLADLYRERLSQQLPLSPFSVDEVAALIDGVTGHATPALAAALHRETEGNPFFVEEILRHLMATDIDLDDPRTGLDGWGVPQGLRQVVQQRLARLSQPAHRLLQAGAVLGDRWPLTLLMTTSAFAFDALVAALAELVQAQVLREEGDGYQFTHALVRRIVYDRLSLPLREYLHLHAAQAIAASAAGDLTLKVTQLAAHYRQAGPAYAAEALDYVQQAAMAARAAYAWETEAAHWQAALELVRQSEKVDPAQHCTLLLALGTARLRAGDPQHAHAALSTAAAHARTHSLAGPLVHALLGQVECVSRAGLAIAAGLDAAGPVALLEEALTVVEVRDSALRAQVLARLALEQYMAGGDDQQGGRSLGRAALAMARRVGDPLTLATVLHAVHKTLWEPEDLAVRLQLTREIVQVAEATGDRYLALSGYNAQISDVLIAGDVPAVDASMQTYAQLVEACHQPPLHQHAVAVQRAMRLLLAGTLVEAEQAVHQARAIGERVHCPDTPGVFAGQLFQLRRLQGRLREIDDAAQRAREVTPHPWSFCATRALLHSELGRRADARREFAHLAAGDFAAVPRRVTWVLGINPLAQAADACVFLRDVPRARVLYDRLLPYAGHAVVGGAAVTCSGSAARSLGGLATVMGEWDAAAGHFEAAMAMNTRMGAQPWLAHTQRQYAGMLLLRGRRGDRRRARQVLEAAQAIYTDLGMGTFATQTQGLLSSPRLVRMPAMTSRFPDSLTAREVEVLRLVAAGKSNREISAELVLSVRTTGRHIANIYGKIGAHNRAGATAYALRHGLTPLMAPV